MTKRNAPYRHSDGSGCWTKNCSLGNTSVSAAVAHNDFNAFINAKQTETLTKPNTKTLTDMFGAGATKVKKAVPSTRVEWKTGFGSRPGKNDYYMSHRAPDGLDDEDAKAAHELNQIFPSDVMEHPDWYCGDVDVKAINVLKSVQGNPEALVTVYRSAPNDVKQINNGDWVTLSKSYALQHGMQDDPKNDWGVMEAKIPVKYLWTEGNDLNEFGVSFPE